MSVKKIKTPKKKAPRVWTKEQAAEFADHLAERGFAIVTQEQIDRQNQFIQAVSQGLNVADPENAGRQIAVVWQDHLALLNDIAKVVMGLGLIQQEVDALIAKGEQVTDELNDRMIKARTIIEKLANHLADKEKAAKEATKFLEVDESQVAEKLAEKASE